MEITIKINSMNNPDELEKTMRLLLADKCFSFIYNIREFLFKKINDTILTEDQKKLLDEIIQEYNEEMIEKQIDLENLWR